MNSVAANPWKSRVVSRYTLFELPAALLACIASLFFPFGIVVVLIAWTIGPVAAAIAALAWTASGLLVVVPSVSEPVVSWLVGARPPTPDELARLGPAWDDVCRESLIDPHRFALRILPCPPPSPDVPWYVNAFAAGGGLVGVTSDALVLLDAEELRGVLAHELGHQAGFDALPRGLVAWYLCLFEALTRPFRVFGLFLYVIYAPILLILAFTSRPAEFHADAFASRIGYGEQLAEVLRRFAAEDPSTLAQAILSSHPATSDRLRRLHALRQDRAAG